MQPLDEQGDPDGDGVTADVGSWGEFEFEDVDWSGPSLVTVEGFHFDESAGNYSGDPISLTTVVEVNGDGNGFLGNVNLLSHLMGQGIRQRMADSDQSLSDHAEAVLGELRDELGLILDPRTLNMFEQDDDALLQHESGVLAELSIAASFHDDLDELLSQFNEAWDDGELTDEFMEQGWDALEDTILQVSDSEDFEQARQRLRDNFNDAEISTQLSSVGGATQVNLCQPTTTTEPVPRVCKGHPQTTSLMPGDSAVYWFRAPYDGAFRFRTTGELSVHDTVVRLARSVDDEGDIGTPRETKTHHDTNTVSTHILEQGDRVYIEVQAFSGANFSDPQEVTLSTHRQNEGSARRPAWIFPQHAPNPYALNEDMQHFVGSQHRSEGDNANNQSFYRFVAWGFSTLRYYEYACGFESLNGHTIVSLYRSNTAAAAFNSDNLVESVDMADHNDEAGNCEVDLDVSPDSQYFVKVESTGTLDAGFGGDMYTRPDATGSPTFSNAGRTVHFKGISD
ncbi:MAG: hypothetical protein LAT62_15245 [Natronospirillum sp.]|uniref:hypothetical protein n=1 Tax=Natronospirillum sp. TaxID=2812955 RepID=UPI0025D85C8F|nr:hypothetical protein [Natronospirillum sp.]MCH8553293.1 hypothetical protein [Natronospirillum sp.]